jgi:hypothetical protein
MHSLRDVIPLLIIIPLLNRSWSSIKIDDPEVLLPTEMKMYQFTRLSFEWEQDDEERRQAVRETLQYFPAMACVIFREQEKQSDGISSSSRLTRLLLKSAQPMPKIVYCSI